MKHQELTETVENAKQLVDFGEAIKALKQGKRVQRNGWNGKGLFIFMQVSADIFLETVPKMQSLPQTVKNEFIKRQKENLYSKEPLFVTENGTSTKIHDHIYYRNQLAMVYPDNIIYGWVASPSDILEEDWIILD